MGRGGRPTGTDRDTGSAGRDAPTGSVVTNLGDVDGDDRGASEHESGDDWPDDLDGGEMRGWIPPDDRLWRHPSERSTPDGDVHPDPPGPARPPRDRTGPWLVGGATACVVVALVAAGLVVATTSSGGGGSGTLPRLASLTVPTTEPGLKALAPSAVIASMVAAVRPSTVALLIDTATGTVLGTGLVVEAGGMIATTSPAIRSARAVSVLEQNGNLVDATTVGTDPTSGISVLHVADDLPAARGDFSGPATGSSAVAMAVEPARRSGGSPTEEVYGGEVVATGMTLDLDPVSSTFAVMGVEAPLTTSDIGCPLLDSGGQVAGVLDRVGGTGLRSASTFLPAELVWGVADQLISTGHVDPGSLGITSADTEDPVGALVTSVVPGGPAAVAGLEVRDVVTAVDSYPVRSPAELDTRLYADPPGTQVTVTVDRAGATLTRMVDLADTDPDAPEHAPSP